MFKDELGGKIIKEFCTLRAKAYAYLMGDDSEVKKSKGTKKPVIKQEFMSKNYKYCLFNDEVILKSQQRFKSDHHKVYTEKFNKIVLSSNDYNRLQNNAFKVCKSKIMAVRDLFLEKYANFLLYDQIILQG